MLSMQLSKIEINPRDLARRFIYHPSLIYVIALALYYSIGVAICHVMSFPEKTQTEFNLRGFLFFGAVLGSSHAGIANHYLYKALPLGAKVCLGMAFPFLFLPDVFFPHVKLVQFVGLGVFGVLMFGALRWPRTPAQLETMRYWSKRPKALETDHEASEALSRVREFAIAWRSQRDHETIADVQGGAQAANALAIEDLETLLNRAGVATASPAA